MGREPVCHHFYEVDPVDPMEVDVEATYHQLVPLFASAAGYFLSDRHDAWEIVKPSTEWLQNRIPALLETEKNCKFGTLRLDMGTA